MPKPEPYVSRAGDTTYRVRFRHAGKHTSQTFFRQRDAATFAALLDNGGPAEALSWLEQRQSPGHGGYTFAEWFDHYVANLTGITERTRADYHAQHRRYLTSLDRLPLAQVTRPHVSAIINGMEKAGRSRKTIANALNLLASCLTAAVDEGHIPRNPARKMRLPRTAVEDDAAAFLTAEEFARLVAEIPDHYQPLVAFLVASGLRWSEATALQWRDVDFVARTVKVRRAWKRVPGVGFELGPPKSEKSRRTVNPAATIWPALEPLRGKPTDLVFTTPGGSPISHANFHARIWRPAVARAGLDVTIHALRHTHASWLLSEGMPLEAVQDQLGHESILTTRRVYAHLLPAMGTRVAEAATAAMLQVEQARPALEG